MSNKEFVIPDFVEEPNIKNDVMEFEERPLDPYDAKNGEKVSKKEVKEGAEDIDETLNKKIGKTAFEFVRSLGEGIL